MTDTFDLAANQANAIRAETLTVDAVGNLEHTFDRLLAEWSESPTMLTKLRALSTSHPGGMRRVRGDGSCFPRCYAFGVAETLLRIKEPSERSQLVEQIIATLQEYQTPMRQHYGEYVDDFAEAAIDVLKGVGSGTMTVDLLRERFCGPMGDYIISFYRFLSGHYIRSNAVLFEAFLEGSDNSRDLESFIASEVESIGKEFDQVHIVALTSAVGVGICVGYADLSSQATCSFYRIPDDDKVPLLCHVLYRPGHYDILYPN